MLVLVLRAEETLLDPDTTGVLILDQPDAVITRLNVEHVLSFWVNHYVVDLVTFEFLVVDLEVVLDDQVAVSEGEVPD